MSDNDLKVTSILLFTYDLISHFDDISAFSQVDLKKELKELRRDYVKKLLPLWDYVGNIKSRKQLNRVKRENALMVENVEKMHKLIGSKKFGLTRLNEKLHFCEQALTVVLDYSRNKARRAALEQALDSVSTLLDARDRERSDFLAIEQNFKVLKAMYKLIGWEGQLA